MIAEWTSTSMSPRVDAIVVVLRTHALGAPAHPQLVDDPFVLERVVVMHVTREHVLHVTAVLRPGSGQLRSGQALLQMGQALLDRFRAHPRHAHAAAATDRMSFRDSADSTVG